MLEADEEIREIKKEIIESRGLVIKTNNLVNSLSADIKSIAKRQAGYERRFTWNSATAYVLFAILCFAGLYLASDARISEMRGKQAGLKAEVEELRQGLEKEREGSRLRKQAESRAQEYYNDILKKNRHDIVKGLPEIEQERLSAVERAYFRRAAREFRTDLSVASYQEGMNLMRTGRYAEATEKLEEALEYDDEGAHVPSVQYELARAYRKLERHSDALLLARGVVDQDVDPSLRDDATWLLGRCAVDLGKLDDARDAFRSLVREWPRSEYAPEARKRLGEINLQILRARRPARR